MQADDLAALLMLFFIFSGFFLPMIFLAIVLWTQNKSYAKTIQWLGVFFIGLSFVGSLCLGFVASEKFWYNFLWISLAAADFLALVGLLTFRRERQASRWFLAILATLFLVGLLGMSGWYIGSQMKWRNEPQTYSSVPTLPPSTTPTPSPSASTASMITYTNHEIGYSLKYPQGWSIEEISGSNDLYPSYKYINLVSLGSKYVLLFGIRKPGDTFSIINRSGIGADGDVPIPEMATEILGAQVIPHALKYSGKTREFMYSSNDEIKAKCACEFNAFYSLYKPTDQEEEAANLPSSVLTVPNQILQTVNWL